MEIIWVVRPETKWTRWEYLYIHLIDTHQKIPLDDVVWQVMERISGEREPSQSNLEMSIHKLGLNVTKSTNFEILVNALSLMEAVLKLKAQRLREAEYQFCMRCTEWQCEDNPPKPEGYILITNAGEHKCIHKLNALNACPKFKEDPAKIGEMIVNRMQNAQQSMYYGSSTYYGTRTQ